MSERTDADLIREALKLVLIVDRANALWKEAGDALAALDRLVAERDRLAELLKDAEFRAAASGNEEARLAKILQRLADEGHANTLQALMEAAERVVALYPTIAGTAILIHDANRHVPRNAWDDLADAAHALSSAICAARRETRLEL